MESYVPFTIDAGGSFIHAGVYSTIKILRNSGSLTVNADKGLQTGWEFQQLSNVGDIFGQLDCYASGFFVGPNGTLNIRAGGALSCLESSSIYGTLINDGILYNNSGPGITNYGTIMGSGAVTGGGFFTNSTTGTLAPGNSPGCMTFNYNYYLANNGTLSMEIDGTTPCTGYDRIITGNSATVALGSSSKLALVFGYAAVNNTSFDILTALTVSGTFPGGNISFSNTGAGNVTGITVDYPGGKVRVTVTSPLAVEMVGFSANKEGGHVRLDWETASETNNRGFEIQRSGNGTDWQPIGFEKGNGTTTDRRDYSFLDEKPLAGRSFYRLRQLDFDGKEDFSEIEVVEMVGNVRGFSVFPNPVSEGELTILFDEKMEGEISQIRLFNATGQLVKSTALSHTMDLSGLPTGIYSLEMGALFQKIIVR